MFTLKYEVNRLNPLFWKKKSASRIFPRTETRLRKKSPLDWEENRCIISDFPLDVNTKGIEAGPAKITYYDFIMIKEYKFCKPFLKNRS